MADQMSENYPVVPTDKGVTRQVLSQNEALMTVEFVFEKGSEGALHHHPHVQSTYVKEGSFRFSVDGEEQVLKKGDSIIIRGNAVHGCVALEAGALVDTFTPRRDDFL